MPIAKVILAYVLLLCIVSSEALSKETQGRVVVIKSRILNANIQIEALTDAIISKTLSGYYDIISKENLAILLPPDMSLEQCNEASCEVELGRTISADYVITVDVLSVEEHKIILTKLFNTRTAGMMSSAQTKVFLHSNELETNLELLVHQLVHPLMNPYLEIEKRRRINKSLLFIELGTAAIGGAFIAYANTLGKEEAQDQYKTLNLTAARERDNLNQTLDITGSILLGIAITGGIYSLWSYATTSTDQEIKEQIKTSSLLKNH
jgi:hypothetical protein